MYFIIWFILAVPIGVLVYDFFSSALWGAAAEIDRQRSGIGIPAYIIWLILTTFFIAPYLTGKFILLRFPLEIRSPTPMRQKIQAVFADTWGLLKDISHLSRIILLLWAVAFLFPFGMIVVIRFGGLYYFLPFLAATILIAYKFNKARTTRGVEAYDDKHFTSYEKSLNDYLSLLKRGKAKKKNSDNQ